MIAASEFSVPIIVARPPVATAPTGARRFTLDGSAQLERHLERVRGEVRTAVLHALPAGKVEAILLGGGYGRGEGGVWRTKTGDRPYNDLEFYVALRGRRLLNETRHGPTLRELAHELSLVAGVEVEFKIISLRELRAGPVTMFSSDLVMGHRWVYGDDRLLAGCARHHKAGRIPLAEVTRLLMNRGSGLLFARTRLERAEFTADDADFVGRNLAKARLALGDAVLAAFGRYHWSCREREQRLRELAFNEDLPPWFAAVQRHHRAGVAFKLHPTPAAAEHRATLAIDLAELTALSGRVWLWLESRRLGREFASARDYVMSGLNKCPGTPAWRNLLLHARTFGPRGLLLPGASHYPRERLFDALAILLWSTTGIPDLAWAARICGERTEPVRTFAAAVAAYERLWARFR